MTLAGARPRALDLFSGAGGAAMGLYRAGFDVVGVDIKPQPRYPAFHQAEYAEHFEFIQADALSLDVEFMREFDFIWASPPCQAYTSIAAQHRHAGRSYPDLIDYVRIVLKVIDKPWVIENVPGAPLRTTAQLCGSAFGLRVRRHRLFESSFGLNYTQCYHKLQRKPIDVSGTGARRITRRQDDHGGSCNKPRNLEEARRAIGIDWMNRYEISQAIPPAYSQFIAQQALAVLGGEETKYA